MTQNWRIRPSNVCFSCESKAASKPRRAKSQASALCSRLAISARTKAALAAARARGVKLGGPKLRQAQRHGVASNKAKADRFAANVLPVIEQIKATGVTSLRGISRALNAAALRLLAAASGRQCK